MFTAILGQLVKIVPVICSIDMLIMMVMVMLIMVTAGWSMNCWKKGDDDEVYMVMEMNVNRYKKKLHSIT
jgi:hypothetical protein